MQFPSIAQVLFGAHYRSTNPLLWATEKACASEVSEPEHSTTIPKGSVFDIDMGAQTITPVSYPNGQLVTEIKPVNFSDYIDPESYIQRNFTVIA